MVAPLRYVNISELVGSWPVVPNFLPSGTPTFLPDTMLTKAAILGVQQETSAGYDVGTKSFRLYVDNESVWTTITFGGTGARTLDQVITDINTQVGSTVAFRDNGFLRLESPTSGSTSYLRVASASSPTDVLYELGLFPDTISRAGYLKPAGHPDPTRQVSLPGQLVLAEGEGFSTRAFNRALYQLGVNVERSEALLSRKRVASRDEVALHTYSAPSEEGYQFSGGTFVYTGSATTPSSGDLEKLFVVLDSDGREFTKEHQDVLAYVDLYFDQNPETGQQRARSSTPVFYSDDDRTDRYVVCNDAGMPAEVKNVPMKIIAYVNGQLVHIEAIDPSTGEAITFDLGAPGDLKASKRVEVKTVKCVVEEVRKTVTAGSDRVEGLEETKYSDTLTSSARVDLNNRLTIPGAGFNSLPVLIDPGDVLVWSSHAVTSPFSNNGTYRVAAVIDDETLELVGEDWGPIHLNPDLYSAAPGAVLVRTDGSFWKDPFIAFKEAPDGAIPEDGVDDIRILYLGATTIREASSDPTAFGRGLEFAQEADDTLQRAMLAMIGPSVETIDEYLHGDRRKNIENLDYRLNFEHYSLDQTHPSASSTELAGKHKDIRPDTIDMYPDTTGQTITIRSGGDGGATVKVGLLNKDDQQVFEINAGGNVYVRDGVSPTTDYTEVSDGRVQCYTSSNDAIFKAESDTGTARIQCYALGAGANASIAMISASGTAAQYITAQAGDAVFTTQATNGNADAKVYVGTGTSTQNSTLTIESHGGLGGKAEIVLASRHDETDESADTNYFGQAIKFKSDIDLDVFTAAPQFDIGTKFGAAHGPVMAFDWIEDGSGSYTPYKALRMSPSGAASMGVNVADDPTNLWIQFLLWGTDSHPRRLATGSKVFAPHFLNMAAKNDTGFVYRSYENVANSSEEAAFLGIFAYDDSVSNNDRTWKFIKCMSEYTTHIERFTVNKYGQVCCGLTSTNESNLLALLGDDDLVADTGLWSRGHVIIGDLNNWDRFPATDGVYPGPFLWLVGGLGEPNTPFGWQQGINLYGLSESVRYAQLLNCWYDSAGATPGWKYVNDDDYAVRIMSWALAPGASSPGHTLWSAAPGRAAGSAGELIAEGISQGDWVHGIRWAHNSGHIGLGSIGYAPNSLLHLREDGTAAQLHIEQDGNAACGIYVEASDDTPDPYISIDGGGDLFSIGVDNSEQRLQVVYGSTFDGVTGLNIDANSVVGINSAANPSWDLTVGDNGLLGSLRVVDNASFLEDIGVVGSIRTNTSTGFEFGSYSGAEAKTFYTYQSAHLFNYMSVDHTPPANYRSDWTATLSNCAIDLSETDNANLWYLSSPILVPQYYTDLDLVSVEVFLEWKGGATGSPNLKWTGWVLRKTWNSTSYSSIIGPYSTTTFSDSATRTLDLSNGAYSIVDACAYFVRVRLEDDTGSSAWGHAAVGANYGEIHGVKVTWSGYGLRPGASM